MNASVLPGEIARTVVDPFSYADWDELHKTLAVIRSDFPFALGELEGYDRFWVASKHDDIQAVARQNNLFLSGMTGVQGMQTKAEQDFAAKAGMPKLFRSVVSMNEPDHMKYRLLTQGWFQPKNLQPLQDRIRGIARTFVDKLLATGGECDFAMQISSYFPLRVLMSILGIPEKDEPLMLRLTQEFFGSKDRELNRSKSTLSPIETALVVNKVIEDFKNYFRGVSEQRRLNPTGDLATVIANAEIDGRPINDLEAMGYYITVATAGHDTTSSSLAGAIWALCDNPHQFQRVKDDPSLIPSLVEEAFRWTTPIYQFVRTAAQDCAVRGQQVEKGDRVILLFPSGNRDEEVFERPFEFRLDRKPNRHIAFGYGAHMCLGMHLARMELSIFFQELLPRIRSLELAGEPKRTVGSFIGGPKTVPIRFRAQ